MCVILLKAVIVKGRNNVGCSQVRACEVACFSCDLVTGNGMMAVPKNTRSVPCYLCAMG